jgi:hypothetical protein
MVELEAVDVVGEVEVVEVEVVRDVITIFNFKSIF